MSEGTHLFYATDKHVSNAAANTKMQVTREKINEKRLRDIY